MTNPRTEKLVARLEKGRLKTSEILSALTAQQWQVIVYPDPPWSVRNLLAHFLSAEQELLALGWSIAAGGPGAPHGLDIDSFNAEEQQRLADVPPQDLLAQLDRARRETIAWVATLEEAELDRLGRHPLLGEISLETLIESIYAHQLLHMRDLMKVLQLDG